MKLHRPVRNNSHIPPVVFSPRPPPRRLSRRCPPPSSSPPPPPPPRLAALTFSVSRPFTGGNGVLVDILCASRAAQRCSGLGRAEQTRRGPSGESGASVPLSTSPVNTANGGLLPQHSARTGPADTPDFLIGFVHFPSGRLVADRKKKGRKRV